jgi:hypothetical protein
MRHPYLIIPLLLPLYAFSQPKNQSDTTFLSETLVDKNTIVKSYSNELDDMKNSNHLERSMDYPTQIIRMSGNLENQQITCEQVNEVVEKTLVQKITRDKFLYNFYIVCGYSPETNLAIQYTINSYFDPLDDKAIEFLEAFLAEYNGTDFLGTKLNIESAKGLVISLNISAGTKKNPNKPPFIEYRQDRSNFYFKSNYEMKMKFVSDVYLNFFSNDPEKILPFLNKWFFSSAGAVYRAVLRDSNYVELQPEKIFLMSSGNEIFVSTLKYYFSHNCTKYENRLCLSQEAEI